MCRNLGHALLSFSEALTSSHSSAVVVSDFWSSLFWSGFQLHPYNAKYDAHNISGASSCTCMQHFMSQPEGSIRTAATTPY